MSPTHHQITFEHTRNRKSEVSCRTNQMTFVEFKFQLIMHSIGKLTYRFVHPMQPYNTEIDKFTKPNQTEIEKKMKKRRETHNINDSSAKCASFQFILSTCHILTMCHSMFYVCPYMFHSTAHARTFIYSVCRSCV